MKKKLLFVIFGILLFLGIGIAITKITVHDTVPADADRSCVDQILNKPMKKLSLEWLIRITGKTQVVSADAVHGDAKFYTLFHIPLNFNLGINCSLTQVVLTDGLSFDSVGTFHDSTIENGLKAYNSDKMGISFKYPTEYLLFENLSTFNGTNYHSFTIAPKEPMLQAITRARDNFGGEGPPSMSISLFSNLKFLSLEQWMRADTSPSNFNPNDDPGAASSLASTTVAGVPALKWHSDFGLYVNDYVAFLYGGWAVIVSAADMGANTNKDFQTVLSSIQLKSSNNSYQNELSVCNALPNNSTQRVVDTSRLFINLPKDIYPHGDIMTSYDFSTVSGNATAGYISNGGLPGYAEGAISGCWSTYIETDGNGEVDLRVRSAVEDAPDYFVRFIISPI